MNHQPAGIPAAAQAVMLTGGLACRWRVAKRQWRAKVPVSSARVRRRGETCGEPGPGRSSCVPTRLDPFLPPPAVPPGSGLASPESRSRLLVSGGWPPDLRRTLHPRPQRFVNATSRPEQGLLRVEPAHDQPRPNPPRHRDEESAASSFSPHARNDHARTATETGTQPAHMEMPQSEPGSD